MDVQGAVVGDRVLPAYALEWYSWVTWKFYCYFSEKLPLWFPQWLHQSTLPPIANSPSTFPPSQPLLSFAFYWGKVESQDRLNFLNGEGCWPSKDFIGHCISSFEKSVFSSLFIGSRGSLFLIYLVWILILQQMDSWWRLLSHPTGSIFTWLAVSFAVQSFWILWHIICGWLIFFLSDWDTPQERLTNDRVFLISCSFSSGVSGLWSIWSWFACRVRDETLVLFFYL